MNRTLCGNILLGGMLLILGSRVQAADYHTSILNCDGGAAIVEVDRAAPRNVRVRITNPAIKRFFVQEMTRVRQDGFGRLRENYVGKYSLPLRHTPYGEPDLNSDFVLNNVGAPIFSRDDFRGFGDDPRGPLPKISECINTAVSCFNPYDVFVGYQAWREGAGLKVSIFRNPKHIYACTHYDGGGTYPGCRQYSEPSGYAALELANWYFQRCD